MVSESAGTSKASELTVLTPSKKPMPLKRTCIRPSLAIASSSRMMVSSKIEPLIFRSAPPLIRST